MPRELPGNASVLGRWSKEFETGLLFAEDAVGQQIAEEVCRHDARAVVADREVEMLVKLPADRPPIARARGDAVPLELDRHVFQPWIAPQEFARPRVASAIVDLPVGRFKGAVPQDMAEEEASVGCGTHGMGEVAAGLEAQGPAFEPTHLPLGIGERPGHQHAMMDREQNVAGDPQLLRIGIGRQRDIARQHPSVRVVRVSGLFRSISTTGEYS